MNGKILITGAAGFIGFHLSRRLCKEGFRVIGIDNINNYYDIDLKNARLAQLDKEDLFSFHKLDLVDKKSLDVLFLKEKFDYVVNLAAQAGVRYSLINPYAYTESNITGFLNILEACRQFPVRHLIYASSSSVYGANTKMPFSVHDNVDHPISLYAATKKANELMAHTYSALYGIPSTGLRFFTVYGPWGRPDMALFIFTKAIFEGKPINIFNHGKMKRDFTFIDDIIEGITRLIPHIPQGNIQWSGLSPDCATSFAPYKIYNIGNHNPVELFYFVEVLENLIGKKAILNLMDMQEGDVPETFADVNDIIEEIGFHPDTAIERGVKEFVDWYKSFYKISVEI
jgi:UDP-glucuronate 4-epimerase